MKILHIIDSGGFYGAEVVLLHLMQAQIELGLEPELVSIGLPGEKEKPIEVEAHKRGLRVRAFRMRPGPNWFGAFDILKFARKEKADILHSHGYKGNILFGMLPRWIRKLPMVTTLHGWTSTSGLTKMRIYEYLDSISLNFVDQVILVNRGMYTHPRIVKHKKEFQVIDNGIPLSAKSLSEPDKDVIDFCNKGFTLCAIGRLSPEKGFTLLVQAMTDVIKDFPDVRLLIIGDGGLKNQLQHMVEETGLTDRVMMSGYLDEACGYLKYCKGLVMPSLTEGLPITLLEAMRAGVPVVASRVGGIPEVLGTDCGVLIYPDSIGEIHQGISRLLTNETEAQQMVERASSKFRTAYNSATMATKYLDVYSKLLGLAAEKGGVL